MDSQAYKFISKMLNIYYLLYIVIIAVISLKNLDTILTLILVFLPLQMRELFLMFYEEKAHKEQVEIDKQKEEKWQLKLGGSLYFSSILTTVIISFLVRERELILGAIFMVLFLAPLLITMSHLRHAIKELFKSLLKPK